jgi:hypothetical protein
MISCLRNPLPSTSRFTSFNEILCLQYGHTGIAIHRSIFLRQALKALPYALGRPIRPISWVQTRVTKGGVY